MTAVPKAKLTEAEYLAIEEKAEFKSEFYRGEMFAMAGASPTHNRIKDNIAGELPPQLKGGPCRKMTSDTKLKVVRTGLYTYPDVMIVCGEFEFAEGTSDVLVNPVAVAEVLSPSTQRYDRGAKFRQYQQIPSLREIILVEQDEPVVEHFARQPDGNWLLTTLTRFEDELVFESVAARVRLADVYAGVTFPESPER